MKILLLETRGLHIGYVGCYGSEWIVTENLDRLAAEGIVFDQHIAANPDRRSGERIWQTGRYLLPAPDEMEPKEGQNAVGICQLLGQEEVTVEACTASVLHPSLAAAEPAQQTLAKIAQSLNKLRSLDRWLLHVELPSLFPPWNVPQDLIDSYDEPEEEEENTGDLKIAASAFFSQRRRYAAAVTLFDQWLGQLLDELERRGVQNDITLMVMTDSGQSLGEHTSLWPSWSRLHEEIIHIPLIMRLPELAEAGRRVAALTQPVDLLPTLCELFDIAPPDAHGYSLLPLLHGKAKRLRDYAIAGLLADGKAEWALRTQEWSFHLPAASPAGEDSRRALLYVKPDDRWEVNEVRKHHLEWTDRLEHTLKTFVEATRHAGPFQPPRLSDFISKEEPPPHKGT